MSGFTFDESRIGDGRYVAECLREYQSWRKGVGAYSWDGTPGSNKPSPFTPAELTKVEEAAIRILYTASGKGEE